MQASSLRPPAVRAVLISEAIRPLLGVAGRARVQGVYRSAVNVETEIGLLTVALPNVGPLPNGVMVATTMDFVASGLRTGLPAVVNEHRFAVPAAGLEIDLRVAARWSPRLLPAADPAALTGWRKRSGPIRAAAARAIASRPASRSGLGELLSGDVPSSPVGRLAQARLARLATALGREDGPAAASAAVSLVGLGPGLTPSGDDALVGLAAAHAAVGRGRAGFLTAASEQAALRTTAVAAMFLRHAVAGDFAGRLHDLLGALLGASTGEAFVALETTLDWGATSGADALVGVLLGLDAVAGSVARPHLARRGRRRAA